MPDEAATPRRAGARRSARAPSPVRRYDTVEERPERLHALDKLGNLRRLRLRLLRLQRLLQLHLLRLQRHQHQLRLPPIRQCLRK